MHKKRAKSNNNKDTTGSPTGRPTSAPSVFDLMVVSPKSGKGSKAIGSAPTVSAFDWIGYEGLKYSYYYYSYDIISHAIYSSPLLSFFRLLIGALIHHFHHSSKD